jgi:phage host-nuclease inhibitor protein Gam
VQIANLEKYIDNKKSEFNNQIALLEQKVEHMENDKKLKQELISKQTDIVDNLAKQMKKANQEIKSLTNSVQSLTSELQEQKHQNQNLAE